MHQANIHENELAKSDFEPGCLFCELPADKFEVLDENELCLTLQDNYPVSEGHCLITRRKSMPPIDSCIAHASVCGPMTPASRDLTSGLTPVKAPVNRCSTRISILFPDAMATRKIPRAACVKSFQTRRNTAGESIPVDASARLRIPFH
jgi:hypothetical protein